jgi:hypothetical protein
MALDAKLLRNCAGVAERGDSFGYLGGGAIIPRSSSADPTTRNAKPIRMACGVLPT